MHDLADIVYYMYWLPMFQDFLTKSINLRVHTYIKYKSHKSHKSVMQNDPRLISHLTRLGVPSEPWMEANGSSDLETSRLAKEIHQSAKTFC